MWSRWNLQNCIENYPFHIKILVIIVVQKSQMRVIQLLKASKTVQIPLEIHFAAISILLRTSWVKGIDISSSPQWM